MAKVQFLKSYRMWNGGEVVGFDSELAARLVAAKFACIVEDPPVVKSVGTPVAAKNKMQPVSAPEELGPPPRRGRRRRKAEPEE